MFNPTKIVIEAFVGELQVMYERTYGVLEPSYPVSSASSAGSRLRISQTATRRTTMLIIPSW